MLAGSSTTTATTSGPAHAPRPASSMPATGLNPARPSTVSYAARPPSRRGVYPGYRGYRFRMEAGEAAVAAEAGLAAAGASGWRVMTLRRVPCYPARRRAARSWRLPSSLVASSSLLSPDANAALWLAGIFTHAARGPSGGRRGVSAAGGYAAGAR